MPRNYKRKMRRAGYGTRYYSSRKYPGLYRSSSRYVATGRALRRIRRYKLQQAIKSIAEKKFYDNQLQQSSVSNNLNNAGLFLALTDMTQGSGQQQRIGDKCTGSSIEWRGLIYSPAIATTVPYITVRVVFFIWKDDTTPVLGDIVESPADPVFSPFNHDTKVKRKILYEKTWTQYIEPSTYTSTIPNKFCKVVIPLNKLRGINVINFQGGTTTAINHIYFLIVSDTANGIGNNEWAANHEFRYNFIDM